MSKYNGWTNYATWKVNLEMVNEDYYREVVQDCGMDADDLANYLESDIEELATGELDTDGFAYGVVVNFLNEVNWYEIAEHILED